MRTHTGEKRPIPKRKRLPLPIPSKEEEAQEETHVLIALPSNENQQQTTFTIIEHPNTASASFTNFIDPTIIYQITEWQKSKR